MDQRFVGDAVGPALPCLPTLVAHHVLLIGQRRLVERVEQVAHSIGMGPQRELELIGGHRVVVVGAIE